MMMSAYWATELSADQIMSRDLVRYLSTSHWDRHFRHTFLCFCFWFISYFWHHLLSASRGLHPYTVSSFHQLGGVPSLILVNCDLQIISHSLWMTDSEHDITYPLEIKWSKKKTWMLILVVHLDVVIRPFFVFSAWPFYRSCHLEWRQILCFVFAPCASTKDK